MQADFWHKRWERNQIGFHQDQVNPYLSQYWPTLGLAPDSRVLVPLCGKSLDLAWLAGQGLQVLGVELSQRAVEDFFAEQQLQPERYSKGAFTCYRSEGVEIWCGDIFQLNAEDVADCVGLYDRAALIALPVPMRQRYVALLNAMLPPGCQGLLVTMEYDQSRQEGPPFSVPEDEVQRLFGARWQVSEEAVQDILGESWKFVQAGVDSLLERVFRLRG